MHLGATNTDERGAFVESANFICALLEPTPFGVMVLDFERRCVAACAFFGNRQKSSSPNENSPRISYEVELTKAIELEYQNDAIFATALLKCQSGQFVVVDAARPPNVDPGDGQWKLYALPFVVGRERGMALIYEDITEQRITTEAFQAAEQRFRGLVDSAADGIVIFRAEILLYVNAEAVRLLGYTSPDELVGRPLSDLVDVGYKTSFVATLNEFSTCIGAGVFESAFIRRDGATFPVECRASHRRGDNPSAGFLFFRNISERKRIQSRRESAKRIESLARFSSSVGTELQAFTNRLRRIAMRLSESQERRETLSGELLTVSREIAERANQFVLLDEVTDRCNEVLSLEEILSRVYSQLSRTDVAQDNLNGKRVRNLPIDLHIDLEPVEYGVRGDSSLIERSLVTLVLAVWRSRNQKSPLRIQGSRAKSDDRDSRFYYNLTVSFGDQVVRENSIAVASTTSFPAAASPFGTWENGKDLELLGAFALLQAQGCWVETHPGIHGGLCFEIELALDPNRRLDSEFIALDEMRKDSFQYVEDVRAVEQQYSVGETPRNDGPVDSSNHQNRRAFPPILICDDEPRLIALTAGLLREFGFEVLTVRSGAEAIKVAGSQPIDLVVLDINLPGEDARDILIEMQRIAPISVILSSGYTEEDVDPHLLREPAVKAFLSKPYTVDVLVQTIDRVRAESSEKNQSQT